MGAIVSSGRASEPQPFRPRCNPQTPFGLLMDSAEFREELAAANGGELDEATRMLYMCKDGRDSPAFQRLLAILATDWDATRQRSQVNTATYIADCFSALENALTDEKQRRRASGIHEV